MSVLFALSMAVSAFLGAFWLWIGEGAVTRFPKQKPWWYVNPFWWPRRYEKVLGRAGVVLAAFAGCYFLAIAAASLIR